MGDRLQIVKTDTDEVRNAPAPARTRALRLSSASGTSIVFLSSRLTAFFAHALFVYSTYPPAPRRSTQNVCLCFS